MLVQTPSKWADLPGYDLLSLAVHRLFARDCAAERLGAQAASETPNPGARTIAQYAPGSPISVSPHSRVEWRPELHALRAQSCASERSFLQQTPNPPPPC